MVTSGEQPGDTPQVTPRSETPTPARWKTGWLVLCVLSAILFLLPSGLPTESVVLLLCLCGIWAGAIAAAWSSRTLRLLTMGLPLLQLFPIRSGLTRAALLCGFGLLWLALLHANRRTRRTLAFLTAGPAMFAVFLALPGPAAEVTQLRQEYIRSLLPYRGAVYIWGGENRIGIDCSGLVRCGWIDANLRLGVRTANPRLLREAFRTWLQDCSAKELGEGYRGRTHFILQTRALNTVDYTRLLPGDIAVSDSGLHTLAYLGDKTWIEAVPDFNGVKVVHVPEPNDIWFETQMRIVRWRTLE